MSLKPIEKISEGISNQYLIHGIATVALGLTSILISYYIAIPVVFIGICLLIVQTGVLVDTEKKNYKVYRNVLGITFGSWKSLEDSTEVILILSTERKTLRGVMPGAMPIGRSSSVQVRTYDVLLTDGLTTKELNDFLTYKKAKRAANVISQAANITLRDKVAEKIAQNKARRRQ